MLCKIARRRLALSNTDTFPARALERAEKEWLPNILNAYPELRGGFWGVSKFSKIISSHEKTFYKKFKSIPDEEMKVDAIMKAILEFLEGVTTDIKKLVDTVDENVFNYNSLPIMQRWKAKDNIYVLFPSLRRSLFVIIPQIISILREMLK